MAEQWKYLRLTGAFTGSGTGGRAELADDPIYGVLTSQVGVRPGTHEYLRVDDSAILQGQTTPFWQQLIDNQMAEEIDQPTFNGASNLKKKTIGAQDLVGVNPQM